MKPAIIFHQYIWIINTLRTFGRQTFDELARKWQADKVANAVAGNIAILDAGGNLVDSGVTFATDAEVEEALNTALGISNS